MKQRTLEQYGHWVHAGFILLFFLINLTEGLPEYPLILVIIYAANYTFMVGAVVYIHYYFLFTLYWSGRRLLYVVSLVLLMTVFIAVYYAIDYYLPGEYEPAILAEQSWSYYLYDYLLLTMSVAYTSLYYFVEQWVANAHKAKELRNKQLEAELNFLKSQINPHFLFNTLNNIYAYTQTGHPKAALMLERLSSILRFMVYEGGAQRVELALEINAMEDLLEIHRMKNSEQRNIELIHNGVKRLHLVAPLILVNFVENACKHSDVVNNTDGFLRVNITVTDQLRCRLEMENTYREKPKAATPYQGLGLENMKKRLALQYDDEYTLEESSQGGIYRTLLEIPLDRKN